MPTGVYARKPKTPAAALPPIEENDDDNPMRQTRIAAAGTAPPKTSAAPSVFALAAAAKPKRAARTMLDPLAVPIQSGVPIPDRIVTQSVYAVLWQRMKPGDMVELPNRASAGLNVYCKKTGGKCTVRRLGIDRVGVWKNA